MSDIAITSWWKAKLPQRLEAVAAVAVILLLCRVALEVSDLKPHPFPGGHNEAL